MIDTWDPALYEGTPDVSEFREDYLDQFLTISEKSAEEEQQEDVGQAFVDELLLDMGATSDDDIDDEEDFASE